MEHSNILHLGPAPLILERGALSFIVVRGMARARYGDGGHEPAVNSLVEATPLVCSRPAGVAGEAAALLAGLRRHSQSPQHREALDQGAEGRHTILAGK
jgi:hypothetical protein